MNLIKQSSIEEVYQGAVVFPIPASGYLRFTGEDCRDFLQRQTSNDVRLLQPERGVLTVLTSPTARILDTLYLIQEPDGISALTLPGYTAGTSRFLQSRIFFMDKVTISDASSDFSQFELIGPQAEQILASLGINQTLEEHQVISGKLDQWELRVLAMEPSISLGYRLLIPIDP